MATIKWDNGAGNGLWGTADNWDSDTVPGAGDDVVFDGVVDADCTLDEPVAVISIDIQAGYSGDFDAAGFAVTTSGAITCDGSGTISAGDGTWTCGGNFDNDEQGWDFESGLLIIDNSGGTAAINGLINDLHIKSSCTLDGTLRITIYGGTMTIDAGATVTVTASSGLRIGTAAGSALIVWGTLIIGVGEQLEMRYRADIKVKAGATITGNKFRVSQGSSACVISEMAGTWSVTTNLVYRSLEMAGGEYGGTWDFNQNYDGAQQAIVVGQAEGDTVEFSGAVTFDADDGDSGTDYNIDLATYNANVKFSGSLTLSASGTNDLIWQEGGGTVTFEGATIFTDNVGVGSLGDVTINATSLTLASDLTCGDFTLAVGTLYPAGHDITAANDMDWSGASQVSDPAGSTFTAGGNWTASGHDLSGASSTWYLKVTGTAVASGTGQVANCDASGVGLTEITASAGPWDDSGGNFNWDFGAAGIPLFMHHYQLMAG